MQLLRTREREALEMLAEKGKAMGKAVGILKELSEDERVRLISEAQEQYRRDEWARMNGARKEGLAEGHEKGLAEGHEKGLAQGLEIGFEQGRKETASRLLQENFSIEKVAQLTDLSEEEVRSLQQ
jgi:predicted transposase/invertase (TIGR01784 family)